MGRFGFGRATKLVAVMALAAAPALVVVSQTSAGAVAPVTTEAALRSAFENSSTSLIDLGGNITITNSNCRDAAWLRSSSTNLVVDGHGFTVTQNCPDVGIFNGDGTGNLTFQNITLTGGIAGSGNGDSGGAISAISNGGPAGLVTVINSVVTGNTAGEDGGGIYGENSVVVQGGSMISHNQAAGTGGGGGISALGDVSVTDSTVTLNNGTGGGDGGGGIAAEDGGSCAKFVSSCNGAVTIVRSSITSNTSVSEGGGIVAIGIVTVTDSTIADNAATGPKGDSGGFDSETGAVVSGSTISGNSASVDGGGFEANGDTTVTNSTITNNHAAGLGGGIHMWEGNLTLAYDTITNNTALGTPEIEPEALATGSESGEGAHARAINGQAANVQLEGDCQGCGVLTSFGTVIAQPLGGGPNCMVVSTVSQGYNFSDDGTGNSCGFDTSTDTHVASNDPKLGDLADNTGPTLTRLPGPGSPLIDAIPTSACKDGAASGITTDQRGITRPQIKGCDIGAVEVRGASVDVIKVVTGASGNAVPSAGYSFTVTCTDGTTGTLTVANATAGGTSGTLGNILPGSTCTTVEAPVVYTNPAVSAQPTVTYNPAVTPALAEGGTGTVTVTNNYEGIDLLGLVVVIQPKFTG